MQIIAYKMKIFKSKLKDSKIKNNREEMQATSLKMYANKLNDELNSTIGKAFCKKDSDFCKELL